MKGEYFVLVIEAEGWRHLVPAVECLVPKTYALVPQMHERVLNGRSQRPKLHSRAIDYASGLLWERESSGF